jgi:ribosomal protein S18 acetylase RimI-like enzyme
LALYQIAGPRAELVLLHALTPGRGLGNALVEALARLLMSEGVRELWLTATNDNLDALRFHQRRGFRLVAVRAGAMEEARRLKPSIPLVGEFGIGIRDHLRLLRPMIAEDSPL